MVVSLLLAVPAAVGLWLVTGGRALPVATARVATAAAAGLTLLLAVVVAVADPDVDRVWLAELGRSPRKARPPAHPAARVPTAVART